MAMFRKWHLWVACFSLCLIISGNSTHGEDGPLVQRKAPGRSDLTARFTMALPSITDVNWAAHVPDNTTEAETGRFATLMSRVPEDVHSILTSEVELSPIFLVSMDINCDAFTDVAEARQKEQRISRPLLRRVIGASVDLHVKADFLKAHKTSEVKVTVRTLEPGTTTIDPGCHVWFAPIYDDRPANWRRFGPISSPSVDKMPTGTFAIWSVRQGKDGRRDRINIVAGETEKDFDIESPGK